MPTASAEGLDRIGGQHRGGLRVPSDRRGPRRFAVGVPRDIVKKNGARPLSGAAHAVVRMMSCPYPTACHGIGPQLSPNVTTEVDFVDTVSLEPDTYIVMAYRVMTYVVVAYAGAGVRRHGVARARIL